MKELQKEKPKMKEKGDQISSQIRLSTLIKKNKKRKEKHLNRCEKKAEIKRKKRRHFKEERKKDNNISPQKE